MGEETVNKENRPKMKIKKLICYIFGHNYNEAALDNNVSECFRCKRWNYGCSMEGGEGFYLWRYNLFWRIKNKLRMIKWKTAKNDDQDVPF